MVWRFDCGRQSMISRRFACFGRFSRTPLFVVVLFVVLMSRVSKAQTPDERKLLDLTNQARAEAGLKPVMWDAALATAAHAHAALMAQQGEISHRYPGEADLTERAASVGAHFSVIAENIATGYSPGQIQDSWMQSKVHHDNLMNADIDHIGVALVSAHGTLYAVADFSKAVEQLTSAQVEATVGKALTDKGLTLMTDAEGARQYCGLADGASGASLGLKAQFLMRWQNADIGKLPPQLVTALESGRYKQAAVGACAPQGSGGSGPVFSGYRVAVLLF